MNNNRGSIWLQKGTYNAIKHEKELYEAKVDGKVDWGAFLLLLLGLYVANKALQNKEQSKKIGEVKR